MVELLIRNAVDQVVSERIFTFSQVTMSYGKIAPALARASTDKFMRMRFTQDRLRSTVASTQRDLKADESVGTVPLVEVDADLISQTKIADDHKRNISIDFENTEEAYKSKNTLELMRSLLVFKLCTIDFLVDKNKEVSYEIYIMIILYFLYKCNVSCMEYCCPFSMHTELFW